MLIKRELILEAKSKLGEKAAYIIAEDLKLKEFDNKNLKALCPIHDEETPSFIWNPKDNSYKCFGCSAVYGILDHYMKFYELTYLDAVERLFKETGIDYRFSERGIKSKRDYKYPHREKNTDRHIVENYLYSRGISKETLDYLDIQQDNGNNIVFNYYDSNDVLTLVKYRPSHEIKSNENKAWTQKNADTKHLLYNMNRIDPTKPLLIVEGEIDLLSVIEAGFLNVVSVPFGAQNSQWIEVNWDFLEQFEKIIIWSDNDAPGINMRKEACARLGSWRSYLIDLPKYYETEDKDFIELKDANDVLCKLGKQKILDYIETAQEIPVENIVDLYDIADFDIETAPGLYSGFEELNQWIYKFVLGSVIIVTGRNGNGKSVLLNQMFIAEPLNQGLDVFVYSAEMGKPLLKSWIELVLAGRENVKLKNGTIHQINTEAKKQMREWYKNRIHVYDNDKDLSSESILDRLETVVRRFGVKVAVLDNLLTIDLGIASGQETALWQEQKKFIVKLVNFASKYNILIVLVAHPKKTAEFRRLTSDDIAGSGDITNLVHYVLGIHRFTKSEKEGEKDGRGNYKKGKQPEKHDVVIDLFKNRITGHANKEIKMYFDYLSYRFYINPSELWKRYKWDKRNEKEFPIRTDDPNNHTEIPEFIKNGDSE